MTQTEFKNLIEKWCTKHLEILHDNTVNRRHFVQLEASNDSRTIMVDVDNYLKSLRNTIKYPCVLLVPVSGKNSENGQAASKENSCTILFLNKKASTIEPPDVVLTLTEKLANDLLAFLNEYAYRCADNPEMKRLFVDINNCETMPIRLDQEKGTRLELQFMTPFEPELEFNQVDYNTDPFN